MMEIVVAAVVVIVVVVVVGVVAILVAVGQASKRAQREQEWRHTVEESGVKATAELLKSEFVIRDFGPLTPRRPSCASCRRPRRNSDR